MEAILKKKGGQFMALYSEGLLGHEYYPIIGDISSFTEGDTLEGTIIRFYNRNEDTVFELTSWKEAREKRQKEYREQHSKDGLTHYPFFEELRTYKHALQEIAEFSSDNRAKESANNALLKFKKDVKIETEKDHIGFIIFNTPDGSSTSRI